MNRFAWILLALALVGGLHHLLSDSWTRVPGLGDDQVAAIRGGPDRNDPVVGVGSALPVSNESEPLLFTYSVVYCTP